MKDIVFTPTSRGCHLATSRAPFRFMREERNTLARIFHQDADFWVVLGEPGRPRPSQPIDHSIGKTGMAELAVQNGPETA